MLGRASSVKRDAHQGGALSLAERRRLRRRRVLISSGIVLVLLVCAAYYALWQSPLRISHVVMYGSDQSLAQLVEEEMQGSTFGIPNNSTFFIPEGRIREKLMSAYPDIAAVSLFKNGFTGLSVKVDYRTPIARWCGLAPSEGLPEYCYFLDANGVLYAAAATTTKPLNNVDLYAHLESDTLEPLRATLVRASNLPSVFDFARKLLLFGTPVRKIILRDDEVDDILASGTRITYVLGSEQDAYTALSSARNNFNLADGSLSYIDLRFPGKVYVKKVQAPKP